MRVRPVASTGVSRYTKRDMVLGGHYVPAGTLLDVPFDAVHHFPGNWPQDPDAFIPVSDCHSAMHSCSKATCVYLYMCVPFHVQLLVAECMPVEGFLTKEPLPLSFHSEGEFTCT